MQPDYTIIGGGVVGLSVAYGLTRLGRRVTVIDGDDNAYRASRTNFGLVWVQSKGLNAPHYARWSQISAREWRAFADDLQAASGNDLGLRQDGGYDFHLDEDSLAERVAAYEAVKEALGGDYPFEVLGHNALKREEPNIGPAVAGAILHHNDGHVNPLRLLQTLAGEFQNLGGVLMSGRAAAGVTPLEGGGFRIELGDGGRLDTPRVVLCAGLGASQLGPMLGFKAPVRPQRGQVLITEKLPKLMSRPSGIIRQVDEGGVQIGDTKEEVGLDDRTTTAGTAAIASRAAKVYPALARARLVRSWAGLRVMSPDGLPIYQRSEVYPDAYFVTCHSGVTLAAAHARLLPRWLEGLPDAPDLEKFDERRFTV